MGRKIELELHPERAREVAKILLKKLKAEGIFNEKELPDDRIKKHIPEDMEKYLAVLSLVTSLDYMRDAAKLWDSAIKTLEDDEISWVFSPSEVKERGKEKLKEALLKHKMAMRKEKDTDTWWHISKTVAEDYNGSFLSFFNSFNFEMDKAYETLDSKLWHQKLPNLSGRKIFPHWIRTIKEKIKEIPFKNLEKLPIPVDVHVARATFTTGCITGKYKAKSITTTVRNLIIKLWNEALKDENILPIEMFRPLWLLSKHGCHYRKNGDCPKKENCPVKEFCVKGKVVVSASKMEIDTKL
ncbi:N-glycosylase/DNA lyase [Desulfurobacterium atlanticum]|uniref:Endonuclease-3 n=1 Tax=Desulfurobacterium atlanticum TaxID=240169 RepID=A0A238Z3F3_9BACT|nr:N-glycosylase/DNA lyase [Desulfurobacterium atlanticum]SNR77429.1 protein of unknown function [Desulfurobacterium atlanticum]